MTRECTLALGALLALLLIPVSGLAADPAPASHVMVTPPDIKWGSAPPSLPPGQKAAVLFGDPGKPGLFIIRAKVPANYQIPAHWHPTDETVTVLSGTILMGMGDKLDAKAATKFPAGSFVGMQANTRHFFLTEGEAEIQVAGMGPFDITYVNPADDPRKRAAAPATAPAAKK